jgi:hypothetical protein
MGYLKKQPQVKNLPPLDLDEFRKDLREDLVKQLSEPPDEDVSKEGLALSYASYVADLCVDAYRLKIHTIAEDVAHEVAGIPRVN